MKIRFYNKGFRELRTSEGVVADLKERAERIAAAAGEGVEVLPVQDPRNRAHILVGTMTNEASYRNANENTLIKALDAGR